MNNQQAAVNVEWQAKDVVINLTTLTARTAVRTLITLTTLITFNRTNNLNKHKNLDHPKNLNYPNYPNDLLSRRYLITEYP